MRSIPKPVRVTQDQKRLDFVRAMPCLLLTEAPHDERNKHVLWDCFGPSEAHHVRKGAQAGLGRKPPANKTVPLCRAAHSIYHNIGHDAFESKYGINLESHLQRINAEFRKLHPQPRKERKPKPVGPPVKRAKWYATVDGLGVITEVQRREAQLLPIRGERIVKVVIAEDR